MNVYETTKRGSDILRKQIRRLVYNTQRNKSVYKLRKKLFIFKML